MAVPRDAIIRGPRGTSVWLVREGSAVAVPVTMGTASGLLVEKIGGPSVKPWQPPGLWSIGSGGDYRPDEGEGRWRRSLYTYWRRTIPPPGMLIFGFRLIRKLSRSSAWHPLVPM